MIITKEYLLEHRRESGCYTRDQLQALGLNWNKLGKGWAGRLVGSVLSPERAARFEAKRSAKEARGNTKASYGDLVAEIKFLTRRISELEEILKMRKL